ncbi:MAG: hypothetical protein HOJ15_01575 [Candidatus Jacksonbacteria bacterium]|jgi:hypothetical protein|nr:hypothetical protein [Candidatus Jacksonbacteria bacterium]MBT6033982.1 hypothetical protein [Candidatus Jacksonbacteria bacterium]MBT6301099.1 hypothetical protein [Candidatus Jacksonbacteria bacterium]MBT6757222.1 hypothetical protein [Candidatus Jacksonbacteria bacterium]MBT6955336.1 hypothetical protein [Candidatus Jacksonbacteria bacterium]
MKVLLSNQRFAGPSPLTIERNERMATYEDGERTVTLTLRMDTPRNLAANDDEVLSAPLPTTLVSGGILTKREMHEDYLSATVVISDSSGDPQDTLLRLLRAGWKIETPTFSRVFASRRDALGGCIESIPEFRAWTGNPAEVLGVEGRLKEELDPLREEHSVAALTYRQGAILFTMPCGLVLRFQRDSHVHGAMTANLYASNDTHNEVSNQIGLLENGWLVSTVFVPSFD